MSLEKGFDVSSESKQHDPRVALWLQLDQTLTYLEPPQHYAIVSFCPTLETKLVSHLE